MLERTKRGLRIGRSSMRTLWRHPKLVVLPTLSTLSFIFVSVAIFGTMYLGKHANLGWPFFLVGWSIFILTATFVTVFFNAALTFCVLESYSGRVVSLRAGLSAAGARAPLILQWAIYSATVGLAIGYFRGLLRRFGILGVLTGTAASVSWAIATYFVIPALIVEGAEPELAIRRSAEIVKRHWGTAVGTDVAFGLAWLLSLVPPIFLLGYVNSRNPLLAPPSRALIESGVAIIIYLIAVLGIFTTLGTIFRSGLYYFVETGAPPVDDDSMLYSAALVGTGPGATRG